MVSAGTVLTFDVAGSSSWLPHTASGVRSDAIEEMRQTLDVIDVSITTPSFSDDPLRSLKRLQYQAVVIAAPLSDYGDPHDVASFVRTAFTNAAGELPTVIVRGIDPNAGPPTRETPGLDLKTYGLLAVVGLVAIAVIVAFK